MTGGVFSLPRLLAASGFAALGFLAIALELAPVGLDADAPPSPDLLFCLTAWCALHRPEAVSLPPVFLLGLGRDLLTDVPEGAGALTLVLAAVFLSEHRSWFASRPFWSEWLRCIPIFAATLALQWFLVAIVFARPPDFLDLLQLLIVTAGAYVPVALLLRFAFRIGKARDKPRPEGAS